MFRGGFSREAAQQVANASLDMLAGLVNKSLLRKTASGRFEIHELLRQYGAEYLQQRGEDEAARDAHSTYFIDFLSSDDYLALLALIDGRLEQAGAFAQEALSLAAAFSDDVGAANTLPFFVLGAIASLEGGYRGANTSSSSSAEARSRLSGGLPIGDWPWSPAASEFSRKLRAICSHSSSISILT